MAVIMQRVCVFVGLFWCSLLQNLATAALVTRSIPNQYGANPRASFSDVSGEHAVFPSNLAPAAGGLHFSNNMDFTTFPGRILIGAADALYILDMNLEPVNDGILRWNASETSVDNCVQDKEYSARADYYCRNHIRVYSRYPADPDLLFVCGTQSISTAQCRAVNVSSGSFVRAYEAYDVNHTILSTDPDYASYGRFRDLPGDSTSFITWYYYPRTSVRYVYAFELQNIQWNTNRLRFENTLKYGSLDTLISEPAYIADFVDLSYQLADSSPSRNFNYYYAFVRERISYNLRYNADNEQGSFSHAVRVCQDDPGANYTDGTPDTFGTTLKARLYCNFEGPNTGDNPLAASDIRYNNIWSVALSGSGVDGTLGSQGVIMYAAFSGPLTGPPGSAICSFNAQASSPLSSLETNRGLFDTFKEDITIPSADMPFRAKSQAFFDCTGRSRPSEGPDESITTRTSQVSVSMVQITENPLFVFDGYYITSMTTDVVCVVMQSDRSQCQIVNVLLVGTSQGRVMKMWGEGGGQNKLPSVVAEEINLERDAYVNTLRIRMVDNEKFLYAATLPQLYKLSMGRCGRHGNMSECVGSRDPYCVWNAINDTCELSTLNSTMPVPPHIIQNIFDGEIPDIVNVTLTSSQFAVLEGAVLTVMIVAAGNLSADLLSVSLYQGGSRIIEPQNITGFVTGSKSVSIVFPDDQEFLGTQDVRLCLESRDFSAVQFTTRCADVRVTDNDVSNVSLEMSEYVGVEGNAINVDVLTDSTVPDQLVSLSLYEGGSIVDGPHLLQGLTSPQMTVSVSIPNDNVFVGRQNYSLRLAVAGGSGAVVFNIEMATVTVIDNDGFFGQVGLDNLDDVCLKWKTIAIDSKLNSLDAAIKSGIGGKLDISRIGVFCHDTASLIYVAVYRFNVTTSDNNAPELANALQQWASNGMVIEPFKFKVESVCVSEISSLDQELCSFLSVGALSSPDSRGSIVVGLSIIIALLAVAVIALLATTVVTCYCYKKLKTPNEVALDKSPAGILNGHHTSTEDCITFKANQSDVSPQKTNLSTIPEANNGGAQHASVETSCNSNYSSQFSTQFSKPQVTLCCDNFHLSQIFMK